MLLFHFFFLLATLLPSRQQGQVFVTKNGNVHFKSDAPLEVIEASSSALHGAMDLDNRTFAFTLDIKSFQGFNSPLQREHFFENYMETKRFPKSTFTGKLIEATDLAKEGEYTVRAKGKLDIHGVAQERIIKSEVKSKDGKLYLRSVFTVLLKEHDITIPKIVHQKIAEEITVSIEAELIKER